MNNKRFGGLGSRIWKFVRGRFGNGRPSLLDIPLRNPAIKNHRVCYFWPSWKRDGWKSESAQLIGVHGMGLVQHWANDAGNPNQQRAKAALATVS